MDVKQKLEALVGKTIIFNKDIENWETYDEPGMKAVVTRFDYDDVSNPDDKCHRIFINHASFETENHMLQSANYYDADGQAVLTAVQAGYYKAQDWIYLDNDSETWPFEIVVAQKPNKWIDISIDAAPTDGTKFDAWCVHPDNPSVSTRFTNVYMRGDGSGFGWIRFDGEDVHWEYVERDRDEPESIYPIWKITHWMNVPEGPQNDS